MHMRRHWNIAHAAVLEYFTCGGAGIFHMRRRRSISHAASPNDRELNLLSNGGVESFWGALGLELWLFLYFIVNGRRIVIWRAQTIEN